MYETDSIYLWKLSMRTRIMWTVFLLKKDFMRENKLSKFDLYIGYIFVVSDIACEKYWLGIELRSYFQL